MFAVLKTGGKQYKVAKNDVIEIERLPGEAGQQVVFDQVLMLGDGASATAGAPLIAGASVAGTLPTRSSSSRSAGAITTGASAAIASSSRWCGSTRS